MTVVMMEIRMQGEQAAGCKEIIATELEQILRRIGWAEVRCLSSREAPDGEQMRMSGASPR